MGVQVNIEKAKEIQIERWREARKPLLESLDVQYLRSVEQKDESLQVKISKKKQELRDVTNVKLEEIKTAEELSEVWPQCLGQKPNNI